jgi:hypothetical protein
LLLLLLEVGEVEELEGDVRRLLIAPRVLVKILIFLPLRRLLLLFAVLLAELLSFILLDSGHRHP